jgi:hypothetical protein
MNRIERYLVLFCCVALIISGCKKDEENPQVLFSVPAEGQHFTSGEVIQAQATITDDVDLASYTFQIVNGSGNLTTDFNWVANGTISGETYSFSSSWDVSDEEPGNWQLRIQATDTEGNTSSAARGIVIDD